MFPSPKFHDRVAGDGDEVSVKLAVAFTQTLAGELNEVVIPPITTGDTERTVSIHPLLLLTIKVTL